MSATHANLTAAWAEIRAEITDPYVAVERFKDESEASRWWPYFPICDQIDSGWDVRLRGAVSYWIVKSGICAEQSLAAAILLNAPWPEEDATAALNMLSLAHASSAADSAFERFTSVGVVRCVCAGLADPRPLVAEQAANILGGLSARHLSAATVEDLRLISQRARAVAAAIDDADVVEVVQARAESTLAIATPSPEFQDADARAVLESLDRSSVKFARGLGKEAFASLSTFTRALVWASVPEDAPATAVQVLRVEDAERANAPRSAWGIVDEWIAVIRDLLGEDRAIALTPMEAVAGSLIVTLRVNADQETCDALAAELIRAQKSSLIGTAAETLANTLRQRGLRIRVSHVDRNRTAASIDIDDEAAAVVQTSWHGHKVPTIEVPQANDPEKIFQVVACRAAGNDVTTESLGEVDHRQVLYYRAAARVLGLLTTPEEALTRTGWLLHVAQGGERLKRTCAAFEASTCGQAWIEWSHGSRLSDVKPGTASQFLAERSELSGTTVGRRANTLEQWLKKLRDYA